MGMRRNSSFVRTRKTGGGTVGGACLRNVRSIVRRDARFRQRLRAAITALVTLKQMSMVGRKMQAQTATANSNFPSPEYGWLPAKYITNGNSMQTVATARHALLNSPRFTQAVAREMNMMRHAASTRPAIDRMSMEIPRYAYLTGRYHNFNAGKISRISVRSPVFLRMTFPIQRRSDAITASEHI